MTSAVATAVVSVDRFGRILLPKALRERLAAREFLAIVEHRELRLRPVPTWEEMFGRYKKIDMKAFAKQHAEDNR